PCERQGNAIRPCAVIHRSHVNTAVSGGVDDATHTALAERPTPTAAAPPTRLSSRSLRLAVLAAAATSGRWTSHCSAPVTGSPGVTPPTRRGIVLLTGHLRPLHVRPGAVPARHVHRVDVAMGTIVSEPIGGPGPAG